MDEGLRLGGRLPVQVSTGPDGVIKLRSTEALGEYPHRVTDRLEHWARQHPHRAFATQREASGQWRSISYSQMLARARCVGAALLRRGLKVERPVAILSGNDLEHLTLIMGATWAGVPYASVSPAYSLLSQDFAKLRHVLGTLTPGLIFVSDGEVYARAVTATVGEDVEVVIASRPMPARSTTSWETLLNTPPGPDLDAAHAGVGPDSIIKFLFTSGSTLLPKAVTHTHRMLCSNQQMIAQSMPFLQDEPPVLVDWLPWNHTFGGNHNIGLVLHHGGTLYIDEGRPTAQGMAETLRNLREISPTVYFNVPRGFEEISTAMERDDALRNSLYRRCRAFFFAGAGLAQPVWDRLHRLSEMSIGRRLPVITGLGMTETSPFCTVALHGDIKTGHIGLPAPGVEVKLVPLGDKLEIRFAGPHVMPGYWCAPELTREVFDEEGFYRTGDAVKFVDEGDPQLGLLFDGRIAEDFKLSSGTFVSVGPLRTRFIMAGAPYVLDVVVTAPDRAEVGVLVFPRWEECRRLAALPASASMHAVLQSAALVELLREIVREVSAQATGSANRITRAIWLEDPPSIDKGEITDKGSINQRAVLKNRAHLVEDLYVKTAPL